MSLLSSKRSVFGLACAGAVLALAIGFYMEYIMGLAPCPLCIVQRVCIGVFGLICLGGAVQNPALLGQRLYAGAALLVAGLGGATAGRQLWLQSLPPEALPSCLPPLEFMMEVFPVQEILRQVFAGTADCAEVTWSLWGLSLPGWTLMLFLGMTAVSLWLLLWRTSPSNAVNSLDVGC